MSASRPAFGAVDEDAPNRRENHRITEAELAALTDCCVCGSSLAPGDRYLCESCAAEGAAGVAAKLVAERRARPWQEREPAHSEEGGVMPNEAENTPRPVFRHCRIRTRRGVERV